MSCRQSKILCIDIWEEKQQKIEKDAGPTTQIKSIIVSARLRTHAKEHPAQAFRQLITLETFRERFSNFALHGGIRRPGDSHVVPTEKSQSNDIGTGLGKQGSTLSSTIEDIPTRFYKDHRI